MKSFDQLSRRDFLDRTLKLGLAASYTAASIESALAGDRDDRWQIGCYTRPWANYDYRVALDAIAEAGFKYAGLMTTKSEKGNLIISVDTSPEEAQQVGREVKKRGLKAVQSTVIANGDE